MTNERPMTAFDLPALLGGKPARPHGPPTWPVPDDAVCRALHNAYADGSWGKYQGGNVERLEARVADYHGLAGAVSCASGTWAVELALRALKVGAGHEVILAAYDYPGNFLTVHAVGARPVLIDVAAHNWNLAPDLIEAAITPATRVIIASHLHGGMVPMRKVMELASARGLAVVEDAAQAPGGSVDGKKAGTWSDVAVWSFGGSKLLTAGRGGVIFSPHADVLQRARVWSFRGNLVAPLSELQAAVLLPQLDKLDERNELRTRHAELLRRLLAGIPGVHPFTNAEGAVGGYYKFGWQFDGEIFGLSRKCFVAAMRAEGIAVDEGFQPLHLGRSPQRYRSVGDLCEADRAGRGCVVLHHPVLLEAEREVSQVADAVRKIHAYASELEGKSDTG